jgi:putative hydrolase of the HAD superfamily
MKKTASPAKVPHSQRTLWLFDLDNTLHNASHAIFPAIHHNMNAYLAQVLGDGVSPATPALVDATRTLYWQRYGATLLGMIKHHGVRAEDFLREAHRFDDLSAMIRGERGLARLLQRLPGRKILLTNAPRRYSTDVVRHLGLQRHFAQHIAIESMVVHRCLRPKPSRLMLRKLMARERIAARHCILVEDTLSALKAAKALGMRTAWITQYLPQPSAANGNMHPPYVDVRVNSVTQLSNHLHRLRPVSFRLAVLD